MANARPGRTRNTHRPGCIASPTRGAPYTCACWLHWQLWCTTVEHDQEPRWLLRPPMTTPEGWTWVYTCTDITRHLQVMMRSEKARPARLSNQCTSLNTRRHNTCENARSCRTRNMWKHLAVTNNAPRDIDQHVASAARAPRTTQPESTKTSAHPLSQLKPSSSRNLPAPQSSPVTQTATASLAPIHTRLSC